MKRKRFRSTVALGILLLALASVALAQDNPSKFRGLINDYTSATVSGPWEIRGQWQLLVHWDTAKANFKAALTMERSDEGVLLNGGGDFITPAGRHAHTHHVLLANGDVAPLTDANGNPIGFRVTGVATVAGNGGNPPDFAPQSMVQIDIVGGSIVRFSNIKLSFSGPAATHLGTQAFNGVVLDGD